jgi:putative ABC transport system permease protein
MILFIKLFRESIIFAFTAIVANKLRTILTLLGITIGIFAIITVFSVVDSMEKQIRSSIASLGDNIIYVQKWPWAFGGDYPWWKYLNRPVPNYQEIDEIMKRTTIAEAAVFFSVTSRTVEYLNASIPNTVIMGVSSDYEKVRAFELSNGRFISPIEFASGRNVVVIGQDIANNLFPSTEPIGKSIKFFGRRAEIIGVFKQEGSDFMGNSHDKLIAVPVNYLAAFIDVNNERNNPYIMVKGKEGITAEHLKSELTGAMRAIRKLRPAADDDFALNEISLLSSGFDGLFKILKIAGWIIGGFSILVGGFGIANIMFVSVKERTSIIGIQKALGSKKYFILIQFLSEAVMLSLIGGAIGLLIVFFITWLISSVFDMNFMLTWSNILLGLNVSAIIGILSGFIPAYAAANLDPVEAIRSTN